MAENDIYVSYPFDVLYTLFVIARDYPLLASEVKDGCYALISECILKISDLFRR